MKMKTRYRLFLRRKSVYYAFGDSTKTFTSLKTKDHAEVRRGRRKRTGFELRRLGLICPCFCSFVS